MKWFQPSDLCLFYMLKISLTLHQKGLQMDIKMETRLIFSQIYILGAIAAWWISNLSGHDCECGRREHIIWFWCKCFSDWLLYLEKDTELDSISTFKCKKKFAPEYILSNTRGTAQKIVGFSSPMSSTNNLTSWNWGKWPITILNTDSRRRKKMH